MSQHMVRQVIAMCGNVNELLTIVRNEAASSDLPFRTVRSTAPRRPGRIRRGRVALSAPGEIYCDNCAMLSHLRYARRVAHGAQSRQFAAAAAAAAEAVDMPKATGAFGRYASALYSAAMKGGELEEVSADVRALQSMQKTSPAFDSFMNNPTLPRSAKVAALADVAKNADFTSTFSNFMMVIAENGRTSEAENILKSFSEMIASTKGEVVLEVTSTVPLSEWELALLQKKIRNRFFGGVAEFTVKTAIDESLLGGLTVMIGDRFLDLSTKTELRKLTEVIGAS